MSLRKTVSSDTRRSSSRRAAGLERRRWRRGQGLFEELEPRVLLSYVGPEVPAGYAYAQNISAAPTLNNSDAMTSYMKSYYPALNTGGYNAPMDFGVQVAPGMAPINVVHGNSVTKTAVTLYNTKDGAITETVMVPIPSYVTMEGEGYNPSPLPVGVPEGSVQSGTTSTIASNGATESGSTVTITLTAAFNTTYYKVGTAVKVSNVVGDSRYDGTFTITAIDTTNHKWFQYADAGTSNMAAGGSGTSASIWQGADSKLLIYDEDNKVLYELYHASRPTEMWGVDSQGFNYGNYNTAGQWYAGSSATGQPDVKMDGVTDTNGGGGGGYTVWNLNTGTYDYEYGNMTAAGVSFGALEARPDELQAISFTGNTTNGSTQVTGVSSIAGLSVGQVVTGLGIKSNPPTTIASISGTTVTLSAAATRTATAVALGAGVGINHALYMELPQPAWLENATEFPAIKGSGKATVSADTPFYGARVRLKAGVDLSGLAPDQQAVAVALEDYGAYISDTYGVGSQARIFAGGYSLDTNNQNVLNWSSFPGAGFYLPLGDFEFVDQSPQVSAISTTSGNGGTSVTITGKNFNYAQPVTKLGTFDLTSVVYPTTNGEKNTGTSQWYGAQIKVGANPVVVTELGRYVSPGDVGSHQVEVVNQSGGVVIGPITINTLPTAANNFAYGVLSSPVQLAANTTYYLVSQESSGGDPWYSTTTHAIPTGSGQGAFATISGPVSGSGTTWTAPANDGYEFGPVDLKYSIVESGTGLSVLFGGTAAAPWVAYNGTNYSTLGTITSHSDTSITVTAPTRPATHTNDNVDVQVVSGVAFDDLGWNISFTDPSPVTQAVYGYGFSKQYLPFKYGDGSGSVQAAGPTAPPKIGNLSAVQQSSGSIQLSWAAPFGTSSNSSDPGYVTYTVFRGTLGGFEGRDNISTAAESGTTVTITTPALYGVNFKTGQSVAISGIGTTTSTISSATEAAGTHTVTIVTSTADNLLNGNTVVISGFTGAFVGYNGTFTNITYISPTSFSYTDAGYTGLGAASGGKAAGYNPYNGTFNVTLIDAHHFSYTAGSAGGANGNGGTALGALANGLTTPGYTDTDVTAGTTYYYQVAAVNSVTHWYPTFRSNEAVAMDSATPTANLQDASFESDSVLGDNTWNVGGFSSYEWEQVTNGPTLADMYYVDPNWGGPGYMYMGGAGNPNANHQMTVAGVWDPTTDNWVPKVGGYYNPFPNGGFVGTPGDHVAWVDAPLQPGTTSFDTTTFNEIMQATNVVIAANTTYTMTVAVGDRIDTAFAGYQLNLDYGSINPVTGVITRSLLQATTSATAPLSGGFQDETVSFTTGSSGAWIGQNLILVLATVASDNGYQALNQHGNPVVTQAIPQTDFDNVRLDVHATTSDLVTGVTVSTVQGGSTNWYGTKIIIGASNLTVTALGRYILSVHNQTHTVKLVDASTLVDVAGGSASINAATGTVGTFEYAPVSGGSVTLLAGHGYYLLSYEYSGGDSWYTGGTYGGPCTVTTTSAASVVASVYYYGGGPAFSAYGSYEYGPLDLQYSIPQLVVGNSAAKHSAGPELTAAALAPIASEAVQAWTATGLSADEVALLRRVQFVITSLPSGIAGDTTGLGADADGIVYLDLQGGGSGWSLGDKVTPERVDLLTVVAHELGHILGLPDVTVDARFGGVMDTALPVGVRRLPAAWSGGAVPDQAAWTVPAEGTLTIGPGGDSAGQSNAVVGRLASLSVSGPVEGSGGRRFSHGSEAPADGHDANPLLGGSGLFPKWDLDDGVLALRLD